MSKWWWWWLDAARAVVISVEALWVCVVAAVAWWKPAIPLAIGDAFLTSSFKDVWVLLALPVTLLGVAYPIAGKILRPSEKRLVLKDWPHYWRLRLRVEVALFFCLAGAAAVTIGWLLYKGQHLLRGSALALAGVGVGAIALVSVVMAAQTTADIVEGFSGSPKDDQKADS